VSWLFSQALVEEYSAGTSLAGEPSSQLNVMPTQHKFWRNDKMMDSFDLSRFGLTLQLLTDAHGAELLTSFLAGFPAKTSVRGGLGAGLSGERSGLWSHMARIIREVRPRGVFVENSAMLTSRGLDRVLGDLAEMGFDARWGVLSAADLGADHLRERLWIAAYSDPELVSSRTRDQLQHGQLAYEPWGYAGDPCNRESRWVALASEFLRMDDGLAHSVDRTAAIGNGQVPRVAAAAWQILTNEDRT
jgi:site-specific DNA-cytosine methylase